LLPVAFFPVLQGERQRLDLLPDAQSSGFFVFDAKRRLEREKFGRLAEQLRNQC
jgi:hypothetical protein